jgi:hypothetical protein
MNSILQWNAASQQAVRQLAVGPTISSRAYGILNTAIFDTWSAYDQSAFSTTLDDSLQQPDSENTEANKNEAISFAAFTILSDLFPTQIPALTALLNSQGYSDNSNPAAQLGINFANTLLERRRQDGSNQLNNYADNSNYKSVNSATTLADPNYWQPLTVNGRTQSFLTPQWGNIVPFALSSGSEFRAEAPPEFNTEIFRQQSRNLIEISANLTDEQKMIAEYWEDGGGTSFPPGKWMSFGQIIAEKEQLNLDDSVKLFFLLGNAVMDAGIAAWDTKRAYDSIRPISAIQSLYAGQPIEAWGGVGQGKVLMDGANWQPYQSRNSPTPPFAEYVSGHSTFSAAAAEVLQRFTGSDEFDYSIILGAGSSRFEPGITPIAPVTLNWDTFSEAADQAGLSRRYGGIHFEFGDLAGRDLGRKVGDAVWDIGQKFINAPNQIL